MKEERQSEDFSIGDYITFERTFSIEDLAAFANLIGDKNPPRNDAGIGAGGVPRRPVVPMYVLLAPLSTIAGRMSPDEPSLQLGHEVRATRPAYCGECIRYSARIETTDPGQRVLGLRVLALRGDEVVVDATIRVQGLASGWRTPPSLPVCKASRPALAVVTGVVGEVGAAIACALGEKGWHLLLQDLGDEEPRRRLIARLAGLDAMAEFVAADLATADGRAALAAVVGAQENIGMLVHSTSPPVGAPVEVLVAMNHSAFKSLIEAALPAMLLRQDAAVVMIGSAAAERAPSGREDYAVAVAMAANLANGIERRYAAYGVRGLVMLTGAVATQVSGPPQDGSPELLPQEVAEAVLRHVDDDSAGNAVMLEVGRERRGRIGFHLPGTGITGNTAPSRSESSNAIGVGAPGPSSSPAAATLRKVLRLATNEDLSAAELGTTPGWDSLKHIELLLELETALGIRFSAKEMAVTHRFVELDSLCRQKLNGKI